MWKPKYLCLGGGGVKGCGHPGALLVLEHWNFLDEIEGIVCASIGAIVGTLFAIGYSPSEIATISCETDVKELTNSFSMLHSLIQEGYCSNGKFIKNKLQELIAAKCGNPRITLKEACEMTGYDLVLVTVCKTTGKVQYLNKDWDPELPLYKAVMMSSFIPILCKPITWKGKEYIDGGTLDNYPMSYFPPEKTLGIRLGQRYEPWKISKVEKTKTRFEKVLENLGEEESIFTTDNKKKKIASISDSFWTLLDNVGLLVYIMTEELENVRHSKIQFKEICIDSGDITAVSFSSDYKIRMKLVAKGMSAAIQFIMNQCSN